MALDIGTRIFSLNAIDIKLNHALLLESIWSWVHVPTELRQSVAEVKIINFMGFNYKDITHVQSDRESTLFSGGWGGCGGGGDTVIFCVMHDDHFNMKL